MITYTHSFNLKEMISPDKSWNFYPYNTYELSQICYFDIETTGLSADTSNIYLIGVGSYTDSDTFTVIQWFADDYNSEKNILKEFLEYIKQFDIIIHYNGSTFDIPYINKKCKRHAVNPSALNEMKNLDIYHALRKYAALLQLPDKKLKSFERYVGLNRDDTFNGGELIEVYAEYIQNIYLRKENDKLLKLLLLHNYEDITGLSQVASLLFLKEIGKIPVEINNAYLENYKDECFMTVVYNCSLPGDYNFEINEPFYCHWSKNDITLKVPVAKTELRYYFSDYKDYYYMINEHTVMHKSVAVYTDSSVRRKAKKSECFVKKSGMFLPVSKPGCFSDKMHIFKTGYTDKQCYIELTEEVLSDTKWLITYYSQII